VITLELLCSILSGSLMDAEVWTERGYLLIRTENGTWRLSLDKVPASAR
jgi:transcriptional antiterminator Rof (Rho-off)